ncbi:hypothetical protein YK48G_22310 [Lentilactobacillus fungorum]|uniref:DUF5776 domain-containing protein n=1 Tax=Lentilactobacillus fungorum TaxID=2201250 RepID=A0ABQ3W360_9LACO|nr:DUF5776 domain-containing protein [Lentilactobacillus fungorum]GHP14806.1 hypothetical protein YK48G_22310 [Lentilactobacillus fungorum]
MHKIVKSCLLAVASLGLFGFAAAQKQTPVFAQDVSAASDQISPTNITTQSSIWKNWPSIVGSHVKVTEPVTVERNASLDDTANGTYGYTVKYSFSVDNPKDLPLCIGLTLAPGSPVFNENTWGTVSSEDGNTFSKSNTNITFWDPWTYDDKSHGKFIMIADSKDGIGLDFLKQSIANDQKNYTVRIDFNSLKSDDQTDSIKKTISPEFGPATRPVKIFYKDIKTGQDIQAPTTVGDYKDFTPEQYFNNFRPDATTPINLPDVTAPSLSGYEFNSSQTATFYHPWLGGGGTPQYDYVEADNSTNNKTVSDLSIAGRKDDGSKSYIFKSAVIFWYDPTPTPAPNNTGGTAISIGNGSITPTTNSDSTTTPTLNSNSEPASSITTTQNPATPSYAAKKGTAVYATKAIYMYKNATFKKSQRIAKYPKAKRVNRPMFVVIGYARSNNGTLRYKVRDVNHGKKTANKVGYITASRKYVVNVYYKTMPKNKKITVINKQGVNTYKNANLTKKVKNYKQGTHLRVKKIVKHNLTTRYQLSNGTYVTANKKLVIQGNY